MKRVFYSFNQKSDLSSATFLSIFNSPFLNPMVPIFEFKFKRKFHCQLKTKKVRKFVSKSRNRNWIGEKLQTVAAIIESNQSACVFSALCRWKGAEGNIELRAVWIWLKWIQSLNVFCNIANNKRISIKWGEWMYRNENKKQTEFKWKRRINRNQAVTSH